MDLKIDEVASLLHVSQAVIEKWLQEGKIPSYKLGSQHRFSREEVEEWMIRENICDFEEKQESGMQPFALYRALNRGGVYTNVEGNTKEEIIAWTTKQLAAKYDWDAAVLTELLLNREALMPTALGDGIAVPHTRDFLLDTHFDVVACVFLKKPIPYGALDGKPVFALFFLFACEDKKHLHLLAKLAYFMSSNGIKEFLHTQPRQQELLKRVKAWETNVK